MIDPYIVSSPPDLRRCLEDYLLELILIDTIALADPSRDLAAEQVIERCIPTDEYERVMDLYDEMSDDTGPESMLLQPWYARACAKDSRWKLEMIGKIMYVAAGGRILTTEAMAEVAALVEQIGAIPEFRALLLAEVEPDAGGIGP